MRTQTWEKRPVTVTAREVTHHNLRDVAEWCGGHVDGESVTA